MKLESVGILISMRPFGERDTITRIFTRDCGVVCGMMRGAQITKKNRPLVGQIGTMTWNARLDSQLGVFHWDAEKNLAATLMMSQHKLAYMNSAFELMGVLLPEREIFQHLYNETLTMLTQLATNTDEANTYLTWELHLLRELGYGLELAHCSGCGGTQSLEYISPRTGRAVCHNCGAPYADRLYKMPICLNTTMQFLANVCAQQGIRLPTARQILRHF